MGSSSPIPFSCISTNSWSTAQCFSMSYIDNIDEPMLTDIEGNSWELSSAANGSAAWPASFPLSCISTPSELIALLFNTFYIDNKDEQMLTKSERNGAELSSAGNGSSASYLFSCISTTSWLFAPLSKTLYIDNIEEQMPKEIGRNGEELNSGGDGFLRLLSVCLHLHNQLVNCGIFWCV